MRHLGTKRLETKRLILRPFVPEDALPMFQNWAGDPEVTRYLTWLAHQSVSITRALIDRWIKSYDEPNYYQWAIELKSLGEPIGSISAVKIHENDGSVEIGYCIGRPWWGQCLMPEAVRALMDYLFDSIGVSRIIACHHPENLKSGRVMQKCGMAYNGKRYTDEKERELCWYSIDKDLYKQYTEKV